MQNDKMVAEYLIQSLKDNLDDLEEKYSQLNREYKRNYRECNLLQRNHERIKKEYRILEQSVKSKWELIEKNGLTISNHLNQLKFNETNGVTYSATRFNTATTKELTEQIIQNNYKFNNEIKLNGFHKNNLDNSFNNSNCSINKIDKLNNGQLDDLKNNSNVFNELTNGFSNSKISNGLANKNSIQLNDLCKEKRYITDLSSCSSLSSTNEKTSCISTSLIFSEEVYQFLTYIEGKTLNDKINYLLHDKIKKIQRIKELKLDLDDEKIKSIKLESLSLINGKKLNGDLHKQLNQSDEKKTVDCYKKELESLSKQMENLNETKSQIDKEILQLKSRLQAMEDTENELKTEKRKLLRKFRESQAKIEELDTENYHLKKRIDKLDKNSKISLNNFE